jgi:uroporphyrin-3 C-methyltransferase
MTDTTPAAPTSGKPEPHYNNPVPSGFQSSRTAAMKPRTSGLVWTLLFVVFLLAIAGIGGAFYGWMQSDSAVTLQKQRADTLEKQLADIQKTLTESKEGDSRFRQQTIRVLTENSEKLRGLDRIDTSYWRLAEAEFLLKQAYQRLFITHDAETADLLLASADAAIMQQKDPSLLPVRSAIATDRAALHKVPRVDRDGLYLRLQALSSQIGVLASANRFLQNDNDAPQDADVSYREKLIERLMSIVRIRHYDNPVEPLLPPEQEVYLRQNLQLTLVQAQLGLLQNQQQTYSSNLERADAWVRQYCQTEDPVVQSWLDELRSIKRIDIAPELPDISGSLRTVDKIIEKRAEEIQRSLMLEDSDTANDDNQHDELLAPENAALPETTVSPENNASTESAASPANTEPNSKENEPAPAINTSEKSSEAQP